MNATDLIRLGQEIRRRRLALGWTLDQFAEACNVTPNYLGTVESGRRDMHMTTLAAIARALECNIGDLLSDPETDLSAGAREIGQFYDQAPSDAQDAVRHMIEVLAKEYSKKKERDKGQGKGTAKAKSTRRGRDGGSSS
jgi:transcriptional regulator with XRE-family HTH domain